MVTNNNSIFFTVTALNINNKKMKKQTIKSHQKIVKPKS